MPSPKPVPEKVHRMVGKRIRFIRITLGLSEVQLASRLKVSRQAVSNVETGKARITLCSLERYAKALGTTPLHLLKGVW
jgi:transcriptional regulator with XRE-family HTH domain